MCHIAVLSGCNWELGDGASSASERIKELRSCNRKLVRHIEGLVCRIAMLSDCIEESIYCNRELMCYIGIVRHLQLRIECLSLKLLTMRVERKCDFYHFQSVISSYYP